MNIFPPALPSHTRWEDGWDCVQFTVPVWTLTAEGTVTTTVMTVKIKTRSQGVFGAPHTGTHTDRQKDGQTGRQTGRQADRQTETDTDKHNDTDRRRDRDSDRDRERDTDKQTQTETDRLTVS